MPLPSKKDLQDFIRRAQEQGSAKVTRREIARAFNVKGDDRTILRALLKEMSEDGLIDLEGKRAAVKDSLPPVVVLDIVAIDAEGDLECTPPNWKGEAAPPPILLPARAAEKTRPGLGRGDRFVGRLTRQKDGSYVAKPIKHIGQGAERVLGVFRTRKAGGAIEPVDRRHRHDLLVERGDEGGAREGDLVWAETKHSRGYGLRMARVREVVGNLEDSTSWSLIAIANHDIRMEFPPEALTEAEKAVLPDVTGREDLRILPFITIDPHDARDHDDAVCAMADTDEKNEGGWRILVAIADVAWFVTPGSALDLEAKKRGNSTYLPDRVVPMLPERLSNDLCSLREGEDRPAMVADMIFDRNGYKKTHRFYRAIIRSHANIDYGRIQAAFDGNPGEKTAPLMKDVLTPLYQAYQALAKARDKRGPLDLDLPERKIILDTDGNVTDVILKERHEANRLIEEFMIQANVSAAESLEEVHLPAVFRIHDAPDEEKLEGVRVFLESIGYSLPRGDTVKPAMINKILREARERDEADLINQVILRAQAQAVYDTKNIGHFGLNLRRYAHFTSPIRRYADLTVHRGLIAGFNLGKGAQSHEEAEALQKTAEKISVTERASMSAERESKDRFLAAFLERSVGAEFAARISGATRAGLFVTLTETGADGFIPARTLGDEYFRHEETANALIGERSGGAYRVGQAVRVRLREVTPVQGGLLLEMLDKPVKGIKVPGGRKRKSQEHRRPRPVKAKPNKPAPKKPRKKR